MRTKGFDNSRKRAAMLQKIQDGNIPSVWILSDYIKAGLVSAMDVRKPGARGRPSKSYELTGKGRGFLALASKWKPE